MKLNLKNLPCGSLPYHNTKLCKQMMLRLYENVPFLPYLPKINSEDNIIKRTTDNLPCLYINDKGITLENDITMLNSALEEYDSDINKVNGYEKFSSSAVYINEYLAILKRLQPTETVLRLFGPFSLMQKIQNIEINDLLSEQNYRKYIVLSYSLKAQWFINLIQKTVPNIKILILFEEPLLNKFGSIKRRYDSVTKESLITLYAKIFSKIHHLGGYVGVECFEKCNWQIPIDSGVDLISFDGYNNPSSLSIIYKKINNFLAGGGYINWGFVPVNSENTVKNLKPDVLSDKLTKSMTQLACDGVHSELLFSRSTVSTIGNMDNLSIFFAEKALILSMQLSKKIPVSFNSPAMNPQ